MISLEYVDLANNLPFKGQLISKCPFGFFKSPQKNNEIFSRISALTSKRGQIKKESQNKILQLAV